MKPLFFLKTQPLLCLRQSKIKKEHGAVSLISAFMIFIFTTLGLTTLLLTQVNLKLTHYRKNSAVLDYASENGIKQGFSVLWGYISQAQDPVILSEQEFSALNQPVSVSENELIERLLSIKIPFTVENKWEHMKWTCETTFNRTLFEEHSTYFISEYEANLQSQAKIHEYNFSKTKELSAALKIFTGFIPLSALTLIKDKSPYPIDKKEFLEKNNISVFSPSESKLSPEIYVTEQDLISNEASEQIAKALNIKIFKPQDLSDEKLREILGLEDKDEPVPEGVYLIQDDLGLGGVFIQGDVEEMILAVEKETQAIKFTLQAGIWMLKFNPQKNQTYFLTPIEQQFFDLTPRGIVIVSGGIKSLRGGSVNPSGEIIVLEQGEQTPSILKGVHLTIITSEEITITDHLTQQGVDWIDSVPYVKDSHSQLNIFAGGNNLIEEQSRTGGISIQNSNSQELKIQASLTSSKGDFSIQGENKTVHIFGSVHASHYRTSQNQLNVFTDNRFLRDDEFLINSPKTKNPILHMAEFKFKEWKEDE